MQEVKQVTSPTGYVYENFLSYDSSDHVSPLAERVLCAVLGALSYYVCMYVCIGYINLTMHIRVSLSLQA